MPLQPRSDSAYISIFTGYSQRAVNFTNFIYIKFFGFNTTQESSRSFSNHVFMSSVLVTGAARGLGLALVQQLVAQPATTIQKIIAVARNNKSTALNQVIDQSNGHVILVVIPDIASEQPIKEALPSIEKALDGAGLDILFNVAGILGDDVDIASETASSLTKVFNVNVGSVQAMTATLLPLLRKGERKTIITIATSMGSVALADQFLFSNIVGYKVSKTAVNMLNALWAEALKKEGFTVMGVSPGWLKTDLGSQYADLDPSVGAEQVMKIALEADKSQTGRFRNIHVPGYENVEGPNKYDGKDLPW